MKRIDELDRQEKAIYDRTTKDSIAIAFTPKMIVMIVALIFTLVGLFFFLFGKKKEPVPQAMDNNALENYVIESIDINELIDFGDPEPALEKNGVEIVGTESERIVDEYWDKVEFTINIKNNTEYSFSFVSIHCAILDEDDNIVGETYAESRSTIPPNKEAKLEGMIFEYESEMKKIVMDYLMYDTDGNNVVSDYRFAEEEVSDWIIYIDDDPM